MSNDFEVLQPSEGRHQRNATIHVLDHGLVRLVDWMGGDISVVRAARTSFDAAWRAGEDEGSDTRLIRYLMNHRHSTPFETVTMTFEVKAPIFVFRQWQRHRTQSYNEVSARYTELPSEYYVPAIDAIGKQSKDNKQSRDIDPMNVGNNETVLNAARIQMTSANAAAFITYRSLLNKGVPRELARSVLPVATYSRMFTTVNLHNLFHFLRLRLHPHAQYEIRQYAQALLTLVRLVAPIATEAFYDTLDEATQNDYKL